MKKVIYILLVCYTFVYANNKISLDETINLVSILSDDVHYLQQERGASCGYISSNREHFNKQLDDIKLNSDEYLEKLNNILKDNQRQKYFSQDDYLEIKTQLEYLKVLRDKVSNGNIDFSRVYSSYTKTIAFFLLKISDISDRIDNQALSNKLYAYTNLLMYKESVGQKRAALSALFSKKDFDKKIYEYFLSSDTQEKIYKKSFFRALSIDEKQFYLKIEKSEVFLTSKKYEKLALKKLRGDNINLNPEDWFEQITHKINKINELEYLMLDHIKTNIIDINNQKKDESEYIQSDDYDINNFVQKLILSISPLVYDLDIDAMPQALENIMKNDKNVEMIEINENIENEMLVKAYKTDKKIIFNKDIPKKYYKLKLKKINLSFDGEIIGLAKIYYKKSNKIGLTLKEEEWIKKNIVTIGVEQWNPVVFLDDKKQIDGISGDFTKIIIKSTGLKVRYIGDEWNNVLNMFKDKKIDILPATYKTQERQKYGLYSDSYFKMKDYIYVKRNNDSIHAMKDLNGKTLAIPRGYGTIEKIEKKFPKIRIILTKNLDESIERVLNGTVDALYDGQISINQKINDELIVGLKGVSQNSFPAARLYYFTNKDKPILNSIIQKALKSISPKVRRRIISSWIDTSKENITDNHNKIKISFLGLISTEQFIFIIVMFMLLGYVLYTQYTKSNILNIKLKVFNTVIISFELIVILFMVYEVILLDRTEHALANERENKFNMVDAIHQLKNSSDDLTHFAQTYAVTQNVKYKKQYEQVLKIRDGKSPRPKQYNSMYWALNDINRLKLHPYSKPISFDNMIKNLPFTQIEFNKIRESKSNSDKLVNLENAAFLEIANRNYGYAINLLHSSDYYKAKENIILPIDELVLMVNKRTNINIDKLNKKIDSQFIYILIVSLIFILGNVFIYILLRKKVNQPIEYLTKVIRKFQKNDTNIEKLEFFDDEIGLMNKEFFTMNDMIQTQTKNLEKQLDVVKISEKKQEALLKELDEEKDFVDSVINSQENFVITTDGIHLKTANKAFMNFYNITSVDEFMEKYGNCICDTFDTSSPDGYIKKMMGDEKWLDYVYTRPYQVHKARIHQGDKDYIFTISADKLNFKGKEVKTAVFNDVTESEDSKKKLEEIYKHTRDSIEYASLIQGALLPERTLIQKYFKDSFVTWIPKDTVGGDIWLFDELRHEDECLLFYIDCTGHGVPGAFVTMIVKAIEREIISKIKEDKNMDISPAWIMRYFNKTMKILLKQEDSSSLSNAGWDGGIIYYNKQEQILKFAGAETPLFYTDIHGELHTIKGNRYSVGYKKCDMNYEYKEVILEVEDGMKFYCTTDGYLDQNGGEKDFPFGKKRFSNIIKNNYKEPMAEQQTIFMLEMSEYENVIKNNDRNDDMTLIGFEIGPKSDTFNEIEVLKYQGIITQNVVATFMDNIESKIDNMGIAGKISTLTIEVLQNMMNYSKNNIIGSREIVPAGFIEILQVSSNSYELKSKNIISVDDKNKIEPKLIEIQSLDNDGIKKRYRELRRSGENSHDKGGGIGFFEIAKLCVKVEYNFVLINEDKYYFEFMCFVQTRKKER